VTGLTTYARRRLAVRERTLFCLISLEPLSCRRGSPRLPLARAQNRTPQQPTRQVTSLDRLSESLPASFAALCSSAGIPVARYSDIAAASVERWCPARFNVPSIQERGTGTPALVSSAGIHRSGTTLNQCVLRPEGPMVEDFACSSWNGERVFWTAVSVRTQMAGTLHLNDGDGQPKRPPKSISARANERRAIKTLRPWQF
jgi:hypothetical protein